MFPALNRQDDVRCRLKNPGDSPPEALKLCYFSAFFWASCDAKGRTCGKALIAKEISTQVCRSFVVARLGGLCYIHADFGALILAGRLPRPAVAPATH